MVLASAFGQGVDFDLGNDEPIRDGDDCGDPACDACPENYQPVCACAASGQCTTFSNECFYDKAVANGGKA